VKKIKVLHSLTRIGSGGVEQRRLLMARHLPPDRFEHIVVCQDISGGLPSEFDKLGWRVETIGAPSHIFDISWHCKAISIARDFKPDIIHGAVYEGEALACSVGIANPKIPVIMEETSDPANRSWKGNMLMRAMLIRANVSIAVSPAVGNYLIKKLRVPAHKVKVIVNAVEGPEQKVAENIDFLRCKLGLSKDDIIIGTVSRIDDSHKRISDLLKAFSVVLKSFKKARLLIIGDGPDLQVLQEKAILLGIKHAVIWAGYQPSPSDFYALMDVFVLASAREAFGLVLVEAMFSKCAVVGTCVGGIPYVLDNGNSGVLVPPFDPERLGKALIKLLEDECWREELGILGYNRAIQHFSAERYSSDIENLYCSLVN